MQNLKMIRIKGKMDDFFTGKIDLQDVNDRSTDDIFHTRSLSAFALVMRCGLDCDAAAKHITDGYHDIGIDAIYIDTAQKKLVLVQSKWRQNGSGGISNHESNSFVNGIERIMSLDFVDCNAKIIAKKGEIHAALHDTDYQVEIVFCHTGDQKIHKYAMRPITKLLKATDDQTTELIKFIEITQQDIYEYLASGGENNNITIDDVCLSNWGSMSEPFKSYYGVTSALAIGEWYTKYGNKLFEKNIRYYKGSTDVNLGIKEILISQPEKFFYFNNGIKLLCKKITRKAVHSTDKDMGVFKLEGVSLVNGAQTTGVIGSIYSESQDSLKLAKILIQIVDTSDMPDEYTTKITKFSNTQNRIETKDFVSLDPEQERIRVELSLSGIQYLYKTGSLITNSENQISLDEAIVSQACSLSELSIVALVKRNIGALTEDINRTPYKLLFNGHTDSFALYNGVLVLRLVDASIKKCELTATGRKRLVLIHGNRFLLHLVLQKLQVIEKYKTEYLKYNELEGQVNSLVEEYWEKVFDAMEEKFRDAYPAYLFKNVSKLREIYAAIR